MCKSLQVCVHDFSLLVVGVKGCVNHFKGVHIDFLC